MSVTLSCGCIVGPYNNKGFDYGVTIIENCSRAFWKSDDRRSRRHNKFIREELFKLGLLKSIATPHWLYKLVINKARKNRNKTGKNLNIPELKLEMFEEFKNRNNFITQEAVDNIIDGCPKILFVKE